MIRKTLSKMVNKGEFLKKITGATMTRREVAKTAVPKKSIAEGIGSIGSKIKEDVGKIARKIGTSTGYMLGGATAKVGKALKAGGMAPKKDYTKWNENIKKGKAIDNLK